MMLNAGTARFIFQRTELTEHEREAGRKGVEESEQLNDKQRFFSSHHGIKGISAHFPHLRWCH